MLSKSAPVPRMMWPGPQRGSEFLAPTRPPVNRPLVPRPCPIFPDPMVPPIGVLLPPIRPSIIDFLFSLKIPPNFRELLLEIIENRPIKPSCEFCGTEPTETPLHVVRDCPRARALWSKLLRRRRSSWFYTLPPLEWVRQNILGNRKDDHEWLFEFLAAAWLLRHCKIKGFFEEISEASSLEYGRPTEAVDQLAKQLRHAWCLASSPEGVGDLINWRFPRPETEDEVIINTDASVRQGQTRAGIGGVCRDISGEWIFGFSAFVGDRSVLTSELLAIRTGLSLASRRGYKNLTIESDSFKAVQMMNGFDRRKSGKADSFDRQLVEECLSIINEEGLKCRVVHTLREGNFVADSLAKEGVMREHEDLRVWKEPPPCAHPFLFADKVGISFPRHGRLLV